MAGKWTWFRRAGAPLILATGLAGAAHAQSRPSSADSLHGLVQLDAYAGDTERSWLEQGFGKTEVSRGGLALDQAAIEWRPRFNFAVSGVVTGLYQSRLDHRFDVGEAYLKVKAPPTSLGKASARLGIFYPPISLEHDGVGWTTPNSLSGSALNTWVGEELKVTGAEVSLARTFGDHEVTATGALFGYADTAGTLLTFRGWVLDGERAGLETHFGLPPLSPFAAQFQPPVSIPFRELDHRAGYYLRLEWRPPAPVVAHALYFDNGGDLRSVDSEGQWAWRTRFAEAGLTWQATEDTKIMAQAMSGSTEMGYRMPDALWFDAGFRAAYVTLERRIGEDAVTARIDAFSVSDRSFVGLDDNNEDGWAATAAWRHRLAPHADLLFEGKYIDSRRPSRALAGEASDQGEALLQTALRLSF